MCRRRFERKIDIINITKEMRAEEGLRGKLVSVYMSYFMNVGVFMVHKRDTKWLTFCF